MEPKQYFTVSGGPETFSQTENKESSQPENPSLLETHPLNLTENGVNKGPSWHVTVSSIVAIVIAIVFVVFILSFFVFPGLLFVLLFS